jgi:hypothetical protein
MPLKTLFVGAAALALCAGAAHAATHKSGGTYAAPSQPVAYSKLGAYLKASPSQRAKGDWGASGQATAAAAAPTGTPVNTAATAPAAIASHAAAANDDMQNAPTVPGPATPQGMTAPASPDQSTNPQTPSSADDATGQTPTTAPPAPGSTPQ